MSDEYSDEDARRDRRDLATLRSDDVGRRVRRRLRRRVGDEAAIEARLAAHDARRQPVASPREVLQTAHEDAVGLAREYLQVCSHVWGDDDPDVLANADRIARGDVLPWEARHVIEAERRRADQLRRRSTELAVVASRRRVETGAGHGARP